MTYDPINPLAAHIGGGIIQVKTSYPLSASGEFKRFEAASSNSLNGTYKMLVNSSFNENIGYLRNYGPGDNAYIRVRAIDNNDTPSNWVQAKVATVNKPQVTMRCIAIKGSKILEGSIFSIYKGGKMIGFSANEEIEFD